MKGKADLTQDQKLANNYETAYSNNRAQYSSNYDQPSLNQFEQSKPNNFIMRRTTQYDSEISKQYTIIRSRNNTSLTNAQQQAYGSMDNPRRYRLFVSYLNNQLHQEDFIVYFVANKQSNSGIFSHQRLFVVDSYEKTLKYFSQIPILPMRSLAQLKAPKEVIQLTQVSRFYYNPRQNTIGQVSISWMDKEGKKEWRLNMGMKKMVKEVGVILSQIKQNKKVGLREIKQKVSQIEENKSVSKSKQKDTPFIAEIKQLQSKKQQSNKSLRTINYEIQNSSKTIKNTERNKMTQIKKETIIKQQKVKTVAREKSKQAKVIHPPKTPKKLQNDQNMYHQEIGSHQSKIQQLISASKLQFNQIQEQNQKSKKQLIKIEKKDQAQQKQIDPQLQQSAQSNNNTVQNKQISALQKNITISQKQISPENVEYNVEKRSINPSQILYKSLQQNFQQSTTIRQNGKEKSINNLENQKQEPLKYQERQKLYRKALLEERKQINPSFNRRNLNNLSNQARFSSKNNIKLQDTTSRFSKYENQWAVRWLLAKNRAELAQVYCKFIDKCVAKVQARTQKYSEWYSLHEATKYQSKFHQQGIEFTYLMHQQKSNLDIVMYQQQALMSNLSNNSYLLSCIKFRQNGSLQIAVPLCCIVEWMGVKIFCEASLVSRRLQIIANSDIWSKYRDQLTNFQILSKVSFHNASILQIKLNSRQFLYFQKASIMPILSQFNQSLSNEYISIYVREGVVRNEKDLQLISLHIRQSLIKDTIQSLQTQDIISSIQFKNILRKIGLTQKWTQYLLEESIKQQKGKSTALCFAHLLSLQLINHIRERMHCHLMKKTAQKSILDVIYQQLGDWFKQKAQILQIMKIRMNKYKSIDFSVLSQFSQQYVLTSVLLQFGLSIEIKARPDLLKLESTNACFWKEIEFDSRNVLLSFTPRVQSYSYEVFQQNYAILNQHLFVSEKMAISDHFNIDKLLKLINHSDEIPFWQSQMYRLMDQYQKICVNQYLANYLPYDPKNSPQLCKLEWMYDSLQTNSLSAIVAHKHFNISLLGIKWLIKSQNLVEAKLKLNQQLVRSLIWCKHIPQLQIDAYDLKYQHAELTHDYEQARASGMLSLQKTINHFTDLKHSQCSMIVTKLLRVADSHFKLSKFQKSLQLYENVADSLQKMEDEQIHNIQDEYLIQIYNRKIKILMAMCRIKEAVESCHACLQKYERYSIIFNLNKDILHKIVDQQFTTYLLLLRCHQIYQDYSLIYQLITEINPRFIQETILSSQNVTQLTLSDHNRYKFIELTKYLWLAAINTITQTNFQKEGCQRPVSIDKITFYVEALMIQSRGLYRYTMLQVYKHIASIIATSSRKIQVQANKNHSILLSVLLQNFRRLSELQVTTKRCKIYDQKNQEDPLLFMQCMLHVMGYQFAAGTLLQLQNQPIF